MATTTVTPREGTDPAPAIASPRPPPRRVVALAARVAVAGTILFNAGWLVAETLQEGYDPRRAYLSTMAAADASHPWVMVTAFLAAAVAAIALGIGLAHAVPGRLVKGVAASCVLSGVGLCVSALARHDCNVAQPECGERVEAGLVSRGHEIHDVASALVFVVVGVSQVMLARGLRGRPGHRHLRLPSLAMGVLGLGLFAALGIAGFSDWAGTAQRGVVVTSSLWVCLVGVHLERGRWRWAGEATVQD